MKSVTNFILSETLRKISAHRKHRTLKDRLKIVAIEPYYGLSHRMFLEGYSRYSRHEVEIWHLPARKWKWRMRGSAYHFAERARSESRKVPEVIFASDFLNLADWRALCPPGYRDVPSLLYFHENQISYPLADRAPTDYHYGWINLSSALAADRVLFNSIYQRELFLEEVGRVLQRMPDHVPPDLVSGLREKSGVFPVGIDFEPHEKLLGSRELWSGSEPAILWNHRWEHDKDPEKFVDGLLSLKKKDIPFRVAICGEDFGKSHPAFELAASELGDRVVQLGFLSSADEYRRTVSRCDLVVSTARHEFFGVSVVEAMFLGCLPVLPNDLSYPEIVPPHLHPLFLYRDDPPFAEFLARFLREPPLDYADEVRAAVERYHWRSLAPLLDDHIEVLLRSARPMAGG